MKKFKRKIINLRGIRNKLIIVMVLICILPLALVGTISYQASYNILKNNFNTDSQQTLDEINRGMDNYFNSLVNIENMLSSNNNLKNLDDHADYEASVQDYLKNVQESNKDIELINFVLTNKKIINFPITKYASDYDPTARDWYKGAMSDKGKIYISDPFKSTSSGNQVISFSKTIESDGNIKGVVMFTVNLSKLSKSFSNIKVGKAGYVYLTTSLGVMIAHPDSSLIGTDTVAKLSYWDDVKSAKNGVQAYKYKDSDKFVVHETNELTKWKVFASVNKSELLANTDTIKYVNIIAILILFVVALILAGIISKSIVKNIYKLQSLFKKAAEGDLSVRSDIKAKDEFNGLSQDFNTMMTNISDLIKNVRQSSVTIHSTSEGIATMANETNTAVSEVAQTINQVAVGSSEQSTEIGESVDALDVLGENINNIEHVVEKINALSSETDRLSENGLKFMDKLMSKTKQGAEHTGNASKVISDMDKSTEEIGLITDTINSIADQTNLLALNAAIEAARAGESGKGFAVVADEIRKLAEQSAGATKQIQELVNMIKIKSSSAVVAMEESKNVADSQSSSVEESMKVFKDISEAIKVLKNEMNLAVTAIEETNTKKNDVIGRMQSISSVSEEASASSEEVSASTEEISATISEFSSAATQLKLLAKDLEVEIGKFKLS